MGQTLGNISQLFRKQLQKLKIKKSLLGLCTWVISVQLILSSSILPVSHYPSFTLTPAHADDGDETPPVELTESIRTGEELQVLLQAGKNGDPIDPATIPAPIDRHRVTGQVVRKYKFVQGADGKVVSVLDREIDLNHLDITAPNVNVVNARDEVYVVYNPRSRELQLNHFGFHESDKNRRYPLLQDSHVIPNVELTSNILTDPNCVRFATTKAGVETILWADIAKKAFTAPISVLETIPNPSEKGAQVTKLESLNRGVEPRPLFPPSAVGDANTPPLETAQEDGSLILTVDREEGPDADVLIPRDEVLSRTSDELLLATAEAILANPDVDSLDTLMPVLHARRARLMDLVNTQMEVLDTPGNTLVDHALRNLSQRTDWPAVSEILKLDENGNDAFEKLRKDPADTFSVDPSDDGAWQADYDLIQEEQAAKPNLTWKEAYTQAKQRDLPKKPEKVGLTQRLIRGTKSLLGLSSKKTERAPRWDEVVETQLRTDGAVFAEKTRKEASAAVGEDHQLASALYDKVVTPTRSKWLAAIMAGVGLHWITNGAATRTVLSAFTHFIQWSADVPVLRLFTESMAKALPFFDQEYAAVRTAAGLAIIIGLYPLTVFCVKKIARWSGKDWDGMTALFNYAMQKLYAGLNYPLQKKLIWDLLLKQENLYNSLKAGVNPSNLPLLITRPWVSNKTLKEAQKVDPDIDKETLRQEALDRNAKRVNEHVDKEALRKSRALLIAACVVARRTQTDVASLLMAAHGKKLSSFLEMLGDTKESFRWSDIFHMVYRGLKKLSDEDINEEIDTDELRRYHHVFSEVAKRFEQSYTTKSWGASLQRGMARLWRTSTRMMSRNVLPYILYGTQGLEVYEKFRNAEMDPESIRICREKTIPDYIFSASIYALQSPDGFGQVPTLGTPGGPRVFFDQVQQIGLGAIVGPDTLTTWKAGTLANPNRPLSDDVFSIYRKQEQGFWEAGLAIARERVNPSNKSTNFFATYARYMENIVTGFQVRLALGAICRILGMGLNSALDGKWAEVPHALHRGPVREGMMLLRKNAFGYEGGQVLVGYTTIWPGVNVVNRDMSNFGTRKLDWLQTADYLIDSGVALGEAPRYQGGVAMLLALHDEESLEDRFKIPPQDYTAELATELQRFSLLKNPVGTLPNNKMGTLAGLVGSFYSGGIFVAVNQALYDPTVGVFAQLPKALLFFGTTWATSKGLSKVTPSILRVGHGCKAWLQSKF